MRRFRTRAVYRVSEAQRKLAQAESGTSLRAYATAVKIPRRRRPIYEPTEKRVYNEVIKSRNIGLPVRDSDVRSWALQFAKALSIHGFKASCGWISKLKKKYRLTYRAITKVGRKTTKTPADELAEHVFMERVEEIVTLEKTHPSRIINFDQTSVLLQNTYGKTLSPVGIKQVHVAQPPGEKERFTVGLAVTGDGQKFLAAIVSKGGVKTAKLVIPDNVNVFSTRTDWWNSKIDQDWIELSFEQDQPEPLFLLRDHFPGHLKFESAVLLDERNVDQVFVPKGMAGIYQPLDVGINAPFKANLKQAYHEWRKERTEVTAKGYLRKPTRQDFVNLVSKAWEAIRPETIENAFVGAQILPEPTYMLSVELVENHKQLLQFSFSSVEEDSDAEVAEDPSLEYSFSNDY
ncbi:hypothetical protein RvY_02012 [Ramazzottius varieornatus]|uniref:HTH CENPB-type domain-containing protein n=1 Tax=Ramazzottius varieornatus TaxID=947166 RepID=A0A1D1USX0_RAMVA|nr:hypothetical protein RvY_02012 [Ramazzottius varieornatus]